MLVSISCIPAQQKFYFVGCIEYENEYQNTAGETMYYAVKPKNWFYVQGNNFKMYDRKKALQELYVGATNELYHFEQGKAVLVADTARRTPRATIKCLTTTATILGYPCQMLQMVRGGLSSLVFYSDAVRVRPADFRQGRSSGWYELLQATDGALPLRTITVNAEHGVTATSEAIAVRPMTLAAADFTTTAPAR
ncbi:hypothetical protein [Hymenobacter arcticus]